MTVEFQKLFEPYCIDKDYTLENTIAYLTKTAAQRGIAPEAVTLSIQQTFAELAQGKRFSTTKCRCGCGIDKSATDLIHYMRDRMFRIDARMKQAQIAEIQNTFNKALTEAKKSRLTNWNRSPVLRMLGYNKVP